ncbi:MAG TPA: hydrogenase maturation nickel metallochaperone HypA [Firmicutes bacterium]|jgi:hydrogenase nickel incorporation protein HypA/HybF|nr:hydrogenase maturation nickel metallochaperone HypA [Bacillota bacterium]
MHELALTEKMFKIILDEAKAHQAKQVMKVTIAVGELSGIVERSVEAYFRLLAKDTIAEQATLEFNRIKARLFCIQCQKEFTKDSRDFTCPDCGNLARLTDTGQQCLVESIEVDNE